jgi:hypothetical protein
MGIGASACWRSSRYGGGSPSTRTWWRSTCPGSVIRSAATRCCRRGRWASSSSAPPTPSGSPAPTSSGPISAPPPPCSLGIRGAAQPGRRQRRRGGPLQLGSRLNDWVRAPDLDRFRRADPRQIVAGALSGIERYPLPDAVREDYLRSYEGDRMAQSMHYVRACPAELPALCDLLRQIQTAVQIIRRFGPCLVRAHMGA